MNNNLSKRRRRCSELCATYLPSIFIGAQRVICGSFDNPIKGTEEVDELEGIW